MTTDKQIEKEKQLLARCEKSLAVEKIKNEKRILGIKLSWVD